MHNDNAESRGKKYFNQNILETQLKISFVGNPNTGKTSLFNRLTGLNQRTGNYPGTTTERKSGSFLIRDNQVVEITDLPGTYSLSPSSSDEQVVSDILMDSSHPFFPNQILIVADALHLKRGLYLLSHILELNIPAILVINRIEVANKKGITINTNVLEAQFGCPVQCISVRKGIGIEQMKQKICQLHKTSSSCQNHSSFFKKFLDKTRRENKMEDSELESSISYKEFITLEHNKPLIGLTSKKSDELRVKERIFRYKKINDILGLSVTENKKQATDFSSRIDNILTHPIWGYVIFFSLLFLIFQAIFSWAQYPMDFIDEGFGMLSNFLHDVLPKGVLSSLIVHGIVPGIGGVLIFIPQIAILFFFIVILEESGYLSRVVFLMDKIMKHFGMSGKSVVPLMSGIACAIPAIMAARNIENQKERLITIFVTPFMTCSARIPVYAILIWLIIPNHQYGPFRLQGIVMMGMYLLGTLAAVLSGFIIKHILQEKKKSFLLLELPTYKIPVFRNVLYTVYQKTISFVVEAGKIILAVSILLWALATSGYNPEKIEQEAKIHYQQTQAQSNTSFDVFLRSYKLEKSYLGTIGKTIEPIVKPLGYDWKIGIALISSIAAREVFVGTLSTIYSVENQEEQATIKQTLRIQRHPNGQHVFGFATGISLLLFYAFALQCMSTIAIVYKETKSWKWPTIQFVYMTIIAYLSALISYQLLQG